MWRSSDRVSCASISVLSHPGQQRAAGFVKTKRSISSRKLQTFHQGTGVRCCGICKWSLWHVPCAADPGESSVNATGRKYHSGPCWCRQMADRCGRCCHDQYGNQVLRRASRRSGRCRGSSAAPAADRPASTCGRRSRPCASWPLQANAARWSRSSSIPVSAAAHCSIMPGSRHANCHVLPMSGSSKPCRPCRTCRPIQHARRRLRARLSEAVSFHEPRRGKNGFSHFDRAACFPASMLREAG